jgi:hypothetical protein
VKLSGIISEANDVAEKYNLQLVEIDSTDVPIPFSAKRC